MDLIIPQPDLTFDAENHLYFWKGEPVPGIHEVMGTVGLLKDYSGVDSFYRDRGIAVHLAIKYYLEGTLDEGSLDPVCRPFFDGFLAFWQKSGSTPLATELALYSETYGFAGTVDLVLTDHIYDFKCSKNPDKVATGFQGEAQKILVAERINEFLPFSALKLPGDGTFDPIPYDSDVEGWPAVMKVYRKVISWKTPRRTIANSARRKDSAAA